ncbi:bacteriocin biosynthesis cyclodehydratase [Bombilactobacillus bombi]|uniref:Bacteriocin biosynthesis cyclodehydratase n=1 Tax=Bombilactobacillus bombi TaxID=1303590 RepID=A0A3R6ZUM0_9LACO|nr:bacteriocin biosynthesis cyclodehydratase [Bombilactobacillus bombi]RHW45413.1 bacteriocin biosynthesis cyclodehydratase [Bombilactobacillus bombi]
MKTYYVPANLKVINNEDSFILHKGVINSSIVEIDKNSSSESFKSAFKYFIEKGSISINSNDELYEDFEQLNKMGLISVQLSNPKNNLIIVNSNDEKFYKNFLSNDAEIIKMNDVLTLDEAKLINEDKDPLKIEKLKQKKQEFFASYSWVYLIDSMYYLTRIRALNRLMKMLKKISTFAISDNDNLYFLAIKHGKTGCFECLENEIMTKFSGMMSDYNEIEENNEFSESLSMKSLILSLVSKEIQSINTYRQSVLMGNYIHFYLPTYEYEFNTNRISTACKVCSTINNIKFQEQNLRSINVLRKLGAK